MYLGGSFTPEEQAEINADKINMIKTDFDFIIYMLYILVRILKHNLYIILKVKLRFI